MRYLSAGSFVLLAGLWIGGWGNALAAGVGLTTTPGCTELKGYLVETAIEGTALYLDRGVVHSPFLVDPAFDNQVPQSAPTGGEDAAPDHSTTNVQEAGVDEPDIVKSDGDHLYLLNGGMLLILDSWPATDTRELSRTKVEGDPVGLLVEGDTAAVFSYIWDFAALPADFAPVTYSLTKLTLFDVADRSAPRLLREIYLEGSYNTARLIDGRVHLVITSHLPVYTTDLRPLPGYQGGTTLPARDALTRGIAWLRGKGLSRLPMDELVPRRQDRRRTAAGAVSEVVPISDCDSFYVPDQPSGTGTISILTLDLADPLGELASTSIVGDNGEVYASRDSLYLVSINAGEWFWAERPQQIAPDTSTVHKFRLGATPQYLASGEVPGWIVNRYALGEGRSGDGTQEVLRIATTEDSWGQTDEGPKNRLFTLVQEGDRLEVLATLAGLGHEGERIYAVRYDGPRGYVVTFRQTDPLYTLDLSDPAAPRVAGELEIPGFSTYLHPIEDGWLLAIGQNTDLGGIDLSLFDVRNPAAPALTDRESIGPGTWSEAMYDPRAFTYFAPLRQLAIPVERWYWGPLILEGDGNGHGYFSGAMVFDVDTATGLTQRGAIYHEQEGEYYAASVRRTLYIGDSEGHAIYTLSDRLLKVSDAGTLSELTWVELPGYTWQGPIYLAEPAPAEQP